MILYRTVGPDYQAVFRHGEETVIFPWSDLLALRLLAIVVPSSAASDKSFWRKERYPWAAFGSPFGIALTCSGGKEMFFEAVEWEELGRLLYTKDSLLSPSQAAVASGQMQQSISHRIADGRVFAFQRPGLRRRMWLIPRCVVRGLR
jgi:hypothetical protein